MQVSGNKFLKRSHTNISQKGNSTNRLKIKLKKGISIENSILVNQIYENNKQNSHYSQQSKKQLVNKLVNNQVINKQELTNTQGQLKLKVNENIQSNIKKSISSFKKQKQRDKSTLQIKFKQQPQQLQSEKSNCSIEACQTPKNVKFQKISSPIIQYQNKHIFQMYQQVLARNFQTINSLLLKIQRSKITNQDLQNSMSQLHNRVNKLQKNNQYIHHQFRTSHYMMDNKIKQILHQYQNTINDIKLIKQMMLIQRQNYKRSIHSSCYMDDSDRDTMKRKKKNNNNKEKQENFGKILVESYNATDGQIDNCSDDLNKQDNKQQNGSNRQLINGIATNSIINSDNNNSNYQDSQKIIQRSTVKFQNQSSINKQQQLDFKSMISIINVIQDNQQQNSLQQNKKIKSNCQGNDNNTFKNIQPLKRRSKKSKKSQVNVMYHNNNNRQNNQNNQNNNQNDNQKKSKKMVRYRDSQSNNINDNSINDSGLNENNGLYGQKNNKTMIDMYEIQNLIKKMNQKVNNNNKNTQTNNNNIIIIDNLTTQQLNLSNQSLKQQLQQQITKINILNITMLQKTHSLYQKHQRVQNHLFQTSDKLQQLQQQFSYYINTQNQRQTKLIKRSHKLNQKIIMKKIQDFTDHMRQLFCNKGEMKKLLCLLEKKINIIMDKDKEKCKKCQQYEKCQKCIVCGNGMINTNIYGYAHRPTVSYMKIPTLSQVKNNIDSPKIHSKRVINSSGPQKFIPTRKLQKKLTSNSKIQNFNNTLQVQGQNLNSFRDNLNDSNSIHHKNISFNIKNQQCVSNFSSDNNNSIKNNLKVYHSESKKPSINLQNQKIEQNNNQDSQNQMKKQILNKYKYKQEQKQNCLNFQKTKRDNYNTQSLHFNIHKNIKQTPLSVLVNAQKQLNLVKTDSKTMYINKQNNNKMIKQQQWRKKAKDFLRKNPIQNTSREKSLQTTRKK